MKKKISTIDEEVRASLNITRDEYALCDYIQYRVADPRQRRSGWCNDNKEEIAEFVGISRRGLLKMINRMAEKNLIEVGAIGCALRVTELWIDLKKRELSSQKDPAKAISERELSSQKMRTKFPKSGNKVPEVNMYKVDKEEKREREHTREILPNVSSTLDTPFPHSPQVPPAPPSPVTPWQPVDPAAELQIMLTDEACKARFFQQCLIPLDQYQSYLEGFRLKVNAEQAIHNNRRDFRSHFFSWATIQHSKKPAADNGAYAPRRPLKTA